eukprot:1083370-Prymnesium_polylepis.2
MGPCDIYSRVPITPSAPPHKYKGETEVCGEDCAAHMSQPYTGISDQTQRDTVSHTLTGHTQSRNVCTVRTTNNEAYTVKYRGGEI